MKTSKTIAYALACIQELAKRTGEFIQVAEIALAQNLPAAYCQKILLALSKAGIVMSVKGQGFTLMLAPETITTLRVLQALSAPSLIPIMNGAAPVGAENSSVEIEESGSVKTISDMLCAKVNGALASLTVAELLVLVAAK